MQPADERMRYDASGPLNRTRNWCILVQGAMCAHLIIIPGIRVEDPAQVLSAEYYEMVSAFARDGADQPFGKTVLPWRSGRNRLVADPHCPKPASDNGAMDSIPVAG